MNLYVFRGKDEPVQIYARDQQHIISLVEHYRERAKKQGDLDNAQLDQWVRTVPTLDQIVAVDLGFVNYHAGMINLKLSEEDMKKDFFSEYMRVIPDFEFRVSPESVGYFSVQRRLLPSLRRDHLYKLQTSGALGSLNFIPEDVMNALLAYDLAPHLKRTREIRERIAYLKTQHPNLA